MLGFCFPIMTSDNKPSWQYVPPTSQTSSDVIDATRFMKGSSRNSDQNRPAPSSAPVAAENTSSAPSVDASSSNNTLSSESSTPASNSSSTQAASQEEPSRQIEYASEKAQQATEYSASAGSLQPEERRHRDYGSRRTGDRRDYRAREEGRSSGYQRGPRNFSQEAPVAPQKKGFFGSIGDFFKKLFGGKKKPATEEPAASYSGQQRYDRGYPRRHGGPRGDFRRGGPRRFRGRGGPRGGPRPPQA